MNHRRVIVALSAGLALTVQPACRSSSKAPDGPVPDGVPEVPAPGPAPAPAPSASPDGAALPTWESVRSSHPEGATNPPRPVLIVDPDGRCFKDWESGMIRPEPHTDDRVMACPDPGMCGTQTQCPPEAEGLLKAWREERDGKGK